MTILQDILAAFGWQARVNENFRSVAPAALYGIDPSSTTGLTLGYLGGEFNGVTVANGMVALTASATNYVVAHKTTGVVTAATNTTNWLNTGTYLQLYQLVAGASTFTIASTSDKRQAIGAAGGGSGMTNPMTTAGDIIYGGTSGTPTRLGVGTNGYVLTLTAGLPTWVASSGGGFSNPMTTNGDLILGGASGAPGRLGVGSNGQVLTVIGGAVGWAAAASGFANPMTTVGDLIVAGAAGAAGRLAAGTATYVLTANGAGVAPTWQAVPGGGGGLTSWTEALNTASPNGTVPVSSFTATNAATNIDAAIVPKGTGAISAQVADSLTAGGGKRGSNSVDWQMSRTAAAQVASASFSVIGGGRNNTAAGGGGVIAGGNGNSIGSGVTNCVISGGTVNVIGSDLCSIGGGNSNQANGVKSTIGGGESNQTSGGDYGTVGGGDRNQATNYNAAVGGGSQNIASGDSSAIPGGSSNLAEGAASVAMGSFARARARGSVARAAGSFSSAGDSQSESYIHRLTTTSATPAAVSGNGSAPSATTCVLLPNNSMFGFECIVSAKVSAFGDRAVFKITGAISRGASAATTAIDGTPTVTTVAAIGGASAWSVAAVANATLGSLEIQVTGAATTTIKWVANIVTTEVVG
ncbi:hypothetical protein [Variovorax sp. PAMC 28711]|uniref:hypothetical protein n=1 Tax=Variovorax sp. PAMC 28711 TaxID=1795631 RepID=UPI00078E42D4|nr:hypothetical protein [Variovorax sp. PAMC 28711]AMM23157.1 hypothetical protein AX767_01300 [Variovorax sp. PAMC 28711]